MKTPDKAHPRKRRRGRAVDELAAEARCSKHTARMALVVLKYCPGMGDAIICGEGTLAEAVKLIAAYGLRPPIKRRKSRTKISVSESAQGLTPTT